MLRNFNLKNNNVYIGSYRADDLIAKYGTPLYVYDAVIIQRQYNQLKNAISYPHLQIHYACKANANSAILTFLRERGASIETVSLGEIDLALRAGFKPDEILYTCSNISVEEQQAVMKQGIMMHLDSLTQIRRFGEMQPGEKIALRINQGIGAGGHKHIITGGPESKFGIDISQLPEAEKLAKTYGLQIVGLHQHIGSSILEEKILIKAMQKLLETAKVFPDLTYLDFGGGFGVPYRSTEKPLDMNSLGRKMTKQLTDFMKEYGKELLVRFEPGRYLVAESGILFVKVTDVKQTPYKTFVGVDSGFNHLIRPAMYDSYHEIVNITNIQGKEEVVSIAGNICESSDFFARDRRIAHCREGDILAIFNTGAYGYTMSSDFNSRSKPMEVLINGQEKKTIT